MSEYMLKVRHPNGNDHEMSLSDLLDKWLGTSANTGIARNVTGWGATQAFMPSANFPTVLYSSTSSPYSGVGLLGLGLTSQNYLAPGERWVYGTGLVGTSSTSGGGVGKFNVAGQDNATIVITRVMVYIKTVASGAANLNVGVAADGSTSANNLLTSLDCHSAAGCFDNLGSAGASGKSCQIMTTSQYVTVTGSADTTGLVGEVWYGYIVPQVP